MSKKELELPVSDSVIYAGKRIFFSIQESCINFSVSDGRAIIYKLPVNCQYPSILVPCNCVTKELYCSFILLLALASPWLNY